MNGSSLVSENSWSAETRSFDDLTNENVLNFELPMSYRQTSPQLPAPCIIDRGLVVNKDDMQRILNDLSHVRYVHILDGKTQSEGEGWIIDVFNDLYQSTLVANSALYINLNSFDYLELQQSEAKKPYFNLVQDNRLLRLFPLSSSPQEHDMRQALDVAALEVMVSQVLSAKWDVQLDDDDDDNPYPF